MEQILSQYYADNAKKLRRAVDNIVRKKYGSIAVKDMDEFYSVANDVFADIIRNNRYDCAKGGFDQFLHGALSLAIIDEHKKLNRLKRKMYIVVYDQFGNPVYDEKGRLKRRAVKDISLSAPLESDENLTLGDVMALDYNMEDDVIEKLDKRQGEGARQYLSKLSDVQRQILSLKMNDKSVAEIKEKLGLSNKQYERHMQEIKSFAHIQALFQHEEKVNLKGEHISMSATQTMENCKTDKISIASIIKRIDKRTIRFDHALQRESDQWSPSMKGNLVSDILQGNKLHPLIFAEQVVNGVPIIWDLDGKQRCTNAYLFVKDGFKICRNIRRFLIQYQTVQHDKKGNALLDEKGFPIAVNRQFDIRGKKFSDLPEELQDRFLDYSFNYDQYLNCTEEDIAYHIERYNDGKPMTSSQKGVAKLGAQRAQLVKSIASMSFFKDLGGYKVCEFRNGAIDRVIVESIMAVNYFDKWNKLDEMCNYLKHDAPVFVFQEFQTIVNRLEKVITVKTARLFNAKDSFLWFGLFATFIKQETDDRKFIVFMEQFIASLHSKAINGRSFDDLVSQTKSTKDKGIVTKKMNCLACLLSVFLKKSA